MDCFLVDGLDDSVVLHRVVPLAECLPICAFFRVHELERTTRRVYLWSACDRRHQFSDPCVNTSGMYLRLGIAAAGSRGRRYVAQDPEVAPLITWLFGAYATGAWTLAALLAKATEPGLRSKGGPNMRQKMLSKSKLNRILARPYYKGIVRFNDVEYQGKHDPLVDEDTWGRVQAMLESHR